MVQRQFPNPVELLELMKFKKPELNGRKRRLDTALTIADLSVAGMTTYFRHAGFPSIDWPTLSHRIARIESLDAWRASADPVWA